MFCVLQVLGSRNGQGQAKLHSSSTSQESLQNAVNTRIDVNDTRDEKGQIENWSTTPVAENPSVSTTAETLSLSKFYLEEAKSFSWSKY